jgi:chromosome partitioning protein
MQVWSLANQKGGCGKTTTAVHLAAALARCGARVLLVDLDPQAHATLALGETGEHGLTVADVLDGGASVESALRHVPGGFHLLPASLALAEFEETSQRSLHPETALARSLEGLDDAFDFVLLDCPPRADGILTVNAVRAADVVLLVVETGTFSLQGALQASDILGAVAAEADEPPSFRVVATLFDRRLRIARETLVAMQARFGDAMFDSVIRNTVRLREAAAFGVPAQELDSNCKAATDFAALAAEVIALGENPRVPEGWSPAAPVALPAATKTLPARPPQRGPELPAHRAHDTSRGSG